MLMANKDLNVLLLGRGVQRLHHHPTHRYCPKKKAWLSDKAIEDSVFKMGKLVQGHKSEGATQKNQDTRKATRKVKCSQMRKTIHLYLYVVDATLWKNNSDHFKLEALVNAFMS